MMFEGGELDNNTQMVDWLSTMGTSDLRVNWTASNPRQKFWIWREEGEIDLGNVELFEQSQDEIWQTLRANSPSMNGRAAYCLFKGTRKIRWSELPLEGVTLVPYGLPEPDRELSDKLADD
jgi:hypothetical protein